MLVGMLVPAACAYVSNSVPANPQTSATVGERIKQLRILTFTAGATPGFPKGAVAWDLIGGTNGSVWFTDIATGAIGKLDPSSDTVTEFTKGLAPYAGPYSIVAGPDKNLWFSDGGNGDIGRVGADGTLTEFPSGLSDSFVAQGIVATNNALWAVELASTTYDGSYLVRVTTDGAVRRVLLPAALTATGPIAADAKGNIWFTAWRHLKDVVLVERNPSGHLTSFDTGLFGGAEPCCPNVAAKRLLLDPRNRPWLTTQYFSGSNGPTNELAVLRPNGFLFPHLPRGIGPVEPSGTAEDDGTLWVDANDPLRPAGGELYRVVAPGQIQAYSVPDAPAGIAVIRHKVWFTSVSASVPGAISEVLDQ
ncbi:MAG TPA: hypothetical protein VGK84_07890 [Candidatus Tumulicola sp.]